jgi:AmmeMemoRadiSam system protein A
MEAWKKEALMLAKTSILEGFWKTNLSWYVPENEELKKLWAAFVTFKKDDGTEHGSLRGCIGSLIATRPLYEDIIINAKNAAFSDHRFLPLQEEETNNLIVEISVLTKPLERNFNNIEELLSYLKQNKPGLIIQLWAYQATFLPSVWAELQDEEQFLVHLIYKAWLTPEQFVTDFDQVKIFIYESIEFKDKWENITVIG